MKPVEPTSKDSTLRPVQSMEELPRVLVVDDDQGVLSAVRRLLARSGFEVITAQGPMQAISVLREKEVAVVVSDQMMPGMPGIELLTLIRQNWPATVGIMMTACGDIQLAANAVNRHLIRYFEPKPWDNKMFRQHVQEAVEIYQESKKNPVAPSRMDAALRKQVTEHAGKAAFSLARAVDARDRYTHFHSEKVAEFAQVIGKAMGLSDHAMEELRIGGMLHDVGKIGVSDEVLLKPGKLTQEEFRIIQTHPVIGVSIIEPLDLPWDITTIVRQHHENHDGSGYPDRITGGQMALAARIIRVVDSYEAMAADRVYRTARPLDWIKSEFARCKGSQFDPYVVDVFLQELDKGLISYPSSQPLP